MADYRLTWTDPSTRTLTSIFCESAWAADVRAAVLQEDGIASKLERRLPDGSWEEVAHVGV